MSSSEPFNTLGGFSVGIPPSVVIDSTGNVVNNVNAPNANVTANRVFANAFLYANGLPLSIGASGSNTQVQYNNNGLLGASSAFTFNSSTNLLTVTKLQVGSNANLGNVANVVILGGTNGYFLQTDGAGNLTWAPAGNGGNTGNGIPGGANTQVQFNDEGLFGGDAGFTYDKVANIMSVGAITTGNISADDLTVNDISANNITANFFIGDGSNITDVAADTALVAYSVDGSNVVGEVDFAAVANSVAGANVTGQVSFANVANNVAGANVSGQVANALVAGTVYNSTQANITSVGNLTSLTVVGNTTLGNQVVANYFIGNLYGTANLSRTVTYANQPNITSVGTLTGLLVNGNITAANITANTGIFTGNGIGLSSITGANVTGVVANANYASRANTANLANAAYLAGTVTVNAQPNITSVGNLTTLTVVGETDLGTVANLTITGGSPNYVLSTDGNGSLSWVAQTGGNGGGTPGGSNTQIQYNDAGTFGGDSAFTWNEATKYFYVGGNSNISGTLNVASTLNTANFSATGNITLAGTIATATITTANIANLTVTNITSNGNTSLANTTLGTTTLGNTTLPANRSMTLNGTVNTANSSNVNLGSVANLHISGGTNGYVLSTDGSGNLSWVVGGGGGGNGTPGGSNTQVQYNDSGAFGGSGFFTFNEVTNVVNIAGNLVANAIQMGSGIYEFSRSYVYFATTNSTSQQTLLSIDANDLAAVDFTIISDDNTIRNFIKISGVVKGAVVNYAEYSTLPVNGYTGDFELTYNAGNVIVSPSVDLVITPQTGNLMTHRMQVTAYYMV